jgi:hypothetical protein
VTRKGKKGFLVVKNSQIRVGRIPIKIPRERKLTLESLGQFLINQRRMRKKSGITESYFTPREIPAIAPKTTICTMLKRFKESFIWISDHEINPVMHKTAMESLKPWIDTQKNIGDPNKIKMLRKL